MSRRRVGPARAGAPARPGQLGRAGAGDGFVAAEWAVGVAVLLVPVMLLLAVVPTWAADREAALTAAREAARAAATTPAAGVGPATAAAQAVLAGRGIATDRAVVRVEAPDAREGLATATVTVLGRAVVVPLLGRVSGPAATARHQVAVDPFRSRP